MIWFLIGFAALFVGGVLLYSRAEREEAIARQTSPQLIEQTIKTAERAVYEAKNEAEYREALGRLLEVSHRR